MAVAGDERRQLGAGDRTNEPARHDPEHRGVVDDSRSAVAEPAGDRAGEDRRERGRYCQRRRHAEEPDERCRERCAADAEGCRRRAGHRSGADVFKEVGERVEGAHLGRGGTSSPDMFLTNIRRVSGR